MIAPLILFGFSVAGVVAALVVPGWADLILLAGPCALASLFLAIRAIIRAPAGQVQPKKWILVDGSNVLYWQDGTPRIENVRDVVMRLADLGFSPGVMFDANAGYLIAGKYQDDAPLAAILGLPVDQVLVVPKGEPADPALLAAARDMGARIVTNDRYRDWAEAHPQVRDPGYLVRGEYRDGKLWLDLSPAEP